MELRRACEDDVPLLARMLRASYDAMPYIPRLHTPEEDAGYVGGLVSGNEGWVADDDGLVVGFAVLGDDELLQIHVEAEYQNRGIGSTLFLQATKRRPSGFTLWTFQKNEGARRFYERHGCRVAQLTDGARNEEREPDVQYEWRPPAPTTS
jgi:ribosomal protein S18 acetylase RimI-like enzyme